MRASSMSRQTLEAYIGLYLINLRKQVLRTLREICIYIYIQNLLNYNKYKLLSNKLVTKIKKNPSCKGQSTMYFSSFDQLFNNYFSFYRYKNLIFLLGLFNFILNVYLFQFLRVNYE